MWLFFAVLTVLMWGSSDVFFKRASSKEGSVADLIAYNGIVLFVFTLAYMLVKGIGFNFYAIVRYIPVAGCYIASMFFYYAAFRFAKVSIVSPVANSSCAITSLCCVILLSQELVWYQIVGIVIITGSIIMLSVLDQEKEKVKKTMFLSGLVLALVYALLDGVGSYLDEAYIEKYVVSGGNITEDDVIVAMAALYGAVSLVALCYKLIRDKKKGILNKEYFKPDKMKLAGTVFETIGQYTYIYAYASGDAAIASPFIASFSAVSIILSRIFLKEKITRKQYILVTLIIAGMFMLSIE